ncbi:MAG: stalk domain-containing protein [Bacillota bacterium]
MRRISVLLLSLAIMLPAFSAPARSSAASATGLTLTYHIRVTEPDRPVVELDVGGAPSGVTTLTFPARAIESVRNLAEALPSVEVTAANGAKLSWRWAERGIEVSNGSHAGFQVAYTLNTPPIVYNGQRASIFRERILFFIAGDLLLMPAEEPASISVRFSLPAGHRMFSNLPEKEGVFTAEKGLWGNLLDDFPMAYFTGGIPLFVAERETAWGDRYQLVRLDRDPTVNWLPSYGNTPWEEAADYLARAEAYDAYIRQHIFGPLPRRTVIYDDTKNPQDPTVSSILTNRDWYSHNQFWARSDGDLAHHQIHAWMAPQAYSRLAIEPWNPLGAMLEEGIPTYYEHLLPALVRGRDWAPGKLFEFWVLEERGRAANIQANEFHRRYNQSSMRIYLLDQFMRKTANKDLTAFTRALWAEAQGRSAPSVITDEQLRSIFAGVVGPTNSGEIDRLAAKTDFTRADFAALEPAFRLYVDELARQFFWNNRLLVLLYLESAATRGGTWPHYATAPHMVRLIGMDTMRELNQAIRNQGKQSLTQADVLAALSAVTGQDHSGFFAFWSSLGYELSPSSLLPLSSWGTNPVENQFVNMHWQVAGSLLVEHYLSGVKQQAVAVLDSPAPSDTLDLIITVGPGRFVSEAAVKEAISGPNVSFVRSTRSQQPSVRGYFRVKTDDPARRRFPFTLNLPAFDSHPRFGFLTPSREEKELTFLHAFDPIPFAATASETGLTLGAVPSLEGAYLQVGTVRVQPGTTVPLPSGAAGGIQVDLFDRHGFLRGRQTVTVAPPAQPPQPPAPRPVSIVLNGRPLSFDVEPVRVNNRLLVPLRALSEAPGAQVSWDEGSLTATLTYGQEQIRITLGQAVRWDDATQTVILTRD